MLTYEGNGTAPASSADERTKLKRSLGLWMATALVIGNMIGSGVFLLPATMAGTAGPVSILAWVFTGIGAMLLALVFALLGRTYPKTGGPYVYARKAFGDFVGFQTAWGYWIAIWAGNAAIAVAFVSYLSTFWHTLATNSLLAPATTRPAQCVNMHFFYPPLVMRLVEVGLARTMRRIEGIVTH